MGKNWAFIIGINKYNPSNFPLLQYAKRDAELIGDFFQKIRFDEIHVFTDHSPDLVLANGHTFSTLPTVGNLLSFLHDRFEKPFLSTGDNCWFFFAGHGEQYEDRDYVMPADANPRAIVQTAIPVNFIRERLSRSGADNVILILDACRTQGSRSATGIGNEHQQGVITIAACSPTQKSWEVEELNQGILTKALLEAWKPDSKEGCATVEHLSQYLKQRVPELCREYGKAPAQIPRISVDPSERNHFILMPHHASKDDIETLRSGAYKLAFEENFDLAEQLCIRAIEASKGQDKDLLDQLIRIHEAKKRTALPHSSTQIIPAKQSHFGVSKETSSNATTAQFFSQPLGSSNAETIETSPITNSQKRQLERRLFWICD